MHKKEGTFKHQAPGGKTPTASPSSVPSYEMIGWIGRGNLHPVAVRPIRSAPASTFSFVDFSSRSSRLRASPPVRQHAGSREAACDLNSQQAFNYSRIGACTCRLLRTGGSG